MGKSKLTKNSFQIKFSYGSFPVFSNKNNHCKNIKSECQLKKLTWQTFLTGGAEHQTVLLRAFCKVWVLSDHAHTEIKDKE